MLQKNLTIISIALAGILLIGCGSSDDTTTQTGYYVDSNIEGVTYTCGGQNGITGSDGSFIFEQNRDCIFSLANVQLRDVNKDQLYKDVNIIEDNLTVARFLQSIDIDGVPSNGIQIDSQITQTLKDNQFTKIPQTDEELNDILQKLSSNVENFRGRLVTNEDATDHLKTTLTQNTKDLITGKTFYAVTQERYQVDYRKFEFNSDATTLTTTNLISDSDSQITTKHFVIDGRKLIWDDGSYTTLNSINDQYLVFQDYNDIVPEVTRAYYNQTDAQNYYNQIKPEELKFTTSYLNNKTFYDTYQDGDEWQIDALHWTDKILYNDNGDSVNYEITPEGYVYFYTEDDGPQYIKWIDTTNDYLLVCWKRSIEELNECIDNKEYEHFFFDKTKAKNFINNPILY